MENNVETVNRKISDFYDAMADLNIYKNTQYGNIGSQPLNIFAAHMSKDTPAINGILQRLDDKLGRVKNASELRTNDICDLVGYLCLLCVNLGVTPEDIAKFKD